MTDPQTRRRSGTRGPLPTLTPEQVTEIRRRYNVRRPTMRELAEEYGVNHRTIWSVIRDDLYKDAD